ncbi:hypothetical protein JCM8547_007012 [Rhodosporidiobolus lusitaniae]
MLSTVSRFQHFHLDAWQDSDYDRPFKYLTPKEALQKLVKAVAHDAHMRSLSLPSQLHPSFSSSLEPDQHSTRDDLLSTFTSRKVNVIWRLDSKKPVDDEGVSRDFWTYAKELKRRKVIEAEGRAGGSESA